MDGQTSETWTFSMATIWIASRDRAMVDELASRLQRLRERPTSSAEPRWKDLKVICETLEGRKGGPPWVTAYIDAMIGLYEVLCKGSLQAEGISRNIDRLTVIDAETWKSVVTPSLSDGSQIDSFESIYDLEALLHSVRLDARAVESFWPLTADFEVGLWDLGQVFYYLEARTEVGLPSRRTFAPASEERWTRANPKSQHEQQIDDFLKSGKLTAYYRLQRSRVHLNDTAEGRHRSQRVSPRIPSKGESMPPDTWAMYSILDRPNALFVPLQVQQAVAQRHSACLSTARLRALPKSC